MAATAAGAVKQKTKQTGQRQRLVLALAVGCGLVVSLSLGLVFHLTEDEGDDINTVKRTQGDISYFS